MGYLLLPFGIFAGWMAGAVMLRRIVRREVGRLEVLIDSKSDRAAAAPAPPAAASLAVQPAPKPAELEQPEEVAPEIIMVLTAAVAAFLGKRARILGARLVRPAPSSAWAQQGRVFVQASHNLGVVHGR
jgi:methylmalonyl-CoA carboxyltransferase 12S subunit